MERSNVIKDKETVKVIIGANYIKETDIKEIFIRT